MIPSLLGGLLCGLCARYLAVCGLARLGVRLTTYTDLIGPRNERPQTLGHSAVVLITLFAGVGGMVGTTYLIRSLLRG
jgi:hypothetical protein